MVESRFGLGLTLVASVRLGLVGLGSQGLALASRSNFGLDTTIQAEPSSSLMARLGNRCINRQGQAK